MTDSGKLLRIGILLSGEGTSLDNLFVSIDNGTVPAEIAVVIASNNQAGGLKRAIHRNVPAVGIPRKNYPGVPQFNDAIHVELERHGVEFVALLGFLSPFEPRARYKEKVLNVHPALIPAFSGKGYYGRRVHEAVLERGCKVSGATVHFVDEEYDHGPIVLQEPVPVLDDDTPETLGARVQAAERRLVPKAIRLYAEGKLAIKNGIIVQNTQDTSGRPFFP